MTPTVIFRHLQCDMRKLANIINHSHPIHCVHGALLKYIPMRLLMFFIDQSTCVYFLFWLTSVQIHLHTHAPILGHGQSLGRGQRSVCFVIGQSYFWKGVGAGAGGG